jgi:outer membrane protein assembly factor BamB
VNAIVIRCPTCNAALNVPGDAASVTCSYCHSPCLIQQRTRIFQIPRPLQGPPQMPVAQVPVKPGAMVVIGATVTMILGGTIAGLFAFQRAIAPTERTPSPMAEREKTKAATPPSQPEYLQWSSMRPLLRDLDGDGDDDVIGAITTYGGPTRSMFAAAYSGKDGHPLWRSPAIPGGVGNQPMLALAGDHLVLSGDDGKLHGYQLGDGSSAWRVELGEKVRRLCSLPGGELRVITEDDRARDVQLGSGAAVVVAVEHRRQLAKGCDPLPTDDDNTYGAAASDVFRPLPRVSGMNVRYMLKRGTVAVVSGGKSRGTSVPMVARLDKREVKWLRELPSSNALTSRSEEKVLYFDDHVVLATYDTDFSRGETRLVALSPTDGSLLWESPLSSGPGSNVMAAVLATQHHALAVTWTYVMGFDLKTGKLAFKIGT